MKNKIFFIGALLMLLLMITATAYAGQEKVDVCHATGTYDFGQGEVPIGHVINIADPAYDTHIAHGDPEVWTLRTLPDGSEVCTVFLQRIVFVTSASYTANLGGLAGADAKCQALADNAGLDGTYKAWLSDSTTSVEDRLTHSDVPYVLVDGTVVADNWAGLKPSLQAPINLNEYGSLISAALVWTGPGGGLYGANKGTCGDWTGVYDTSVRLGSTSQTTNWDSWGAAGGCVWGFRLFCFED